MTTEKSHLYTHKLVLTSEGSIWGFPSSPVVKNHLPMKWTRVQYLIWEDSTFCRTIKPVHCCYRAHAPELPPLKPKHPRASALQQEKPPQ